MVESKKPNPIIVGMVSFNAQAFFEAVPANRKLAMDIWYVPKCPRTDRQHQEPKNIDNGEWDSGALLALSFVPTESYTGRVGGR
jgi:hypothetical protein